jgi:hypothetical protein
MFRKTVSWQAENWATVESGDAETSIRTVEQGPIEQDGFYM